MKSCKLFEFKLTVCESGPCVRSCEVLLKHLKNEFLRGNNARLHSAAFFSLIGPLISTNAPLWAIKNSV